MTDSAHHDNYSDISATEKLAIALEAYGGVPVYKGRPVTWDMLPKESQVIGARDWRKKQQRASNAFGISEKQLEKLINAIAAGMPDLVAGHLDLQLDEILPLRLQQSESRIVKSLDTAISAAEAARVELARYALS